MTLRRLAVLACVGMFMLVGCRDRSTPQDKSDTLCVKMGEIDGSVTQMVAYAAAPANFAKFRALRDGLAGQWAAVEKAAKDVTSFKIDEVTKTYNAYLKTVTAVNDGNAMTAKYAEIDKTAGDFATARLEAYNSLGCS